jgi:hypothetical protein
LAIYAALGIPELWRWNLGVLTFFVLGDDKTYAEAATSRAFHGIRSADLTPFLERAKIAADENEVEQEFRAWARQRKPV